MNLLNRLSTIEGINLKMYSEKMLPSLLENISSSKDSIAQQYLIDCIINAFPDEYHIISRRYHLVFVMLNLTPVALSMPVDG